MGYFANFGSISIRVCRYVKETYDKIKSGLDFYLTGTKILGNDVGYALSLLSKAVQVRVAPCLAVCLRWPVFHSILFYAVSYDTSCDVLRVVCRFGTSFDAREWTFRKYGLKR